LQAFQKDIKRFEDLNTQVLGVSYDSIETHKKFAQEYGITFPLIADEKKAVRIMYGKGRITFLIDKKGIIRYIQEGVPKNRKFIKQIKKLE
jgi:peroxiredoxin Q/BCP